MGLVKRCKGCDEVRLMRWFPLINPTDPNDSRRSDICNRCDPKAWKKSERLGDVDWSDTRKVADLEERRRWVKHYRRGTGEAGG